MLEYIVSKGVYKTIEEADRALSVGGEIFRIISLYNKLKNTEVYNNLIEAINQFNEHYTYYEFGVIDGVEGQRMEKPFENLFIKNLGV